MKHYFKTIALVLLLTIYSCGKDDEPTSTNTAPEISAQTFTVSEAISPEDSFATVVASDSDGDTLSYSIQTTTSNLFSISATTGTLSLALGQDLDFNTSPTHTITVAVSDGDRVDTAEITINVKENEAPIFPNETFNIDENVPLGSLVGLFGGTDPEGIFIRYDWDPNFMVFAFTIGNSSLRTVDDSSGNLNFEDTPIYNLSIIATDGELSTTATITVNVNDVDEAPEFSDSITISPVSENIIDTFDFATIVATDPEGDSVLFSLTDDANGLIEINADGEISLAPGKSFDYQTATSHVITVEVSDGNLTATKDFTIEITPQQP